MSLKLSLFAGNRKEVSLVVESWDNGNSGTWKVAINVFTMFFHIH